MTQLTNAPYRLCPHVAVVLGLVCVNDPWGYAVETLMPDRSKMRRQTKRDTGVYAASGPWRFTSRTPLFIRRACASEPANATYYDPYIHTPLASKLIFHLTLI